MRYIFLFYFFLTSVFYSQATEIKYDYLNPSLPVEKRVDDLISRMTLEEKASQMINNAEAIPRLQVPEYNWWNECLHGVARAGIATVFPQAIGLAATWNTELMHQVSDVISTEARAKHNDFLKQNDRRIYRGLTFWSPNVNIFRDPRWGRGQETYGEDPYLTGRMGVAFVTGLQGNDSNYFKVIATPKHYAVHSGPEPERHTFNAIIDNRDLYDTYLPAFEACIKEGKAYSVMCAYNRFMGDACCGSPTLLHDILRNKWNFEGYVVSDCGAIDDIYMNHKIVKSGAEAAALAIKAGTDLECGRVYINSIVDAVKQGLLSEKNLNTSLRRLFTARFKLGMFDPPDKVKYASIPIEENDSEEHRKLALRAARESIVLLKNSKLPGSTENILPLKKDIKKIAVIGPNGDSYPLLLGNYNGTPSRYVTPYAGIKNKLSENSEVIFKPGCDLISEGSIRYDLESDFLSYDGNKGLKVEYYPTIDFKGKPFVDRIDPINSDNWVWGNELPDTIRTEGFSARWTGEIKVPESGDYDFILKGSDGFRLYIDDKLTIEDWSEHSISTKSNTVKLEKDKAYNFKIEFFHGKNGWPQFFIQWEFLDKDYFKEAVDLANNSDLIIFVGGISPQLEGEEMPVDLEGFEGGDRTNLDLPAIQEKLLKTLYATGKPVVMVLASGSAMSINWENENIPAIVQIWYPGEEGGTALADVLFGDYNPAGRLPVTFYKSVDQLPPFEDYNMKGRTYRYFEQEPLFPFGYGLSYSKFKYENFNIPKEINAGDTLNVSVRVKNISSVPGDEVVQLYIKDLVSSVPVPIHSLQGLQRVHLEANETKTVELKLLPRQLAITTENIERVIEPGSFEISIGGLQPGTNAETTEYITKEVKVTGNPYKVE